MGFERNHHHLMQKVAGICSAGNMILPHSSPQLDTPMCSKQAWLGLTQSSDNVAPDLRHSSNAWLGFDNDPKNHTTYECTQISGIIGMSPFSGVKEPLGKANYTTATLPCAIGTKYKQELEPKHCWRNQLNNYITCKAKLQVAALQTSSLKHSCTLTLAPQPRLSVWRQMAYTTPEGRAFRSRHGRCPRNRTTNETKRTRTTER